MMTPERAKLITLTSAVFGVPIRLVGLNRKILFSAPKLQEGADPVQTSTSLLDQFVHLLYQGPSAPSAPSVIWDKYNLVFCAFRSKRENDAFFLAGPFVTQATLVDSIPHVIQHYQIQKNDAFQELIEYRCTPHSVRKTLDITRLMYYMEWGFLCNEEFTTVFSEPWEQYDFNENLIDYAHFVRENQAFDFGVDDFFSVLSFALDSEDTTALRKLDDLLSQGKKRMKNYSITDEQRLVEAKYVYFGAISITYKAFLDAGMDKVTAESLWRSYMHQGDAAQDFHSLDLLYRCVVIDFSSRRSTEESLYSSRVKTAINYIATNLHYDIDVSAIADIVGLNKRYLSSLFKKETGMTIQEYILLRRIEEAKSALSLTNDSILKISTYLNFSSQSYFSKAFKKHVGMSPQRYRQNYCKNRGEFLPNFPTRTPAQKKSK